MSGLWKVRSSSSSMLAEQSAATSSESTTVSEQVYNISEFPQDQPIQTLQPDHFRGLQDLRPVAKNNNRVRKVKNLVTIGQCLLFFLALARWSQTQHQPFTQLFSSEPEIKEVSASFPCPVGPSVPQYLQEPRAALIDTGAVAQHSGQLVNVNGGEIKILGQKKTTHSTSHTKWS